MSTDTAIAADTPTLAPEPPVAATLSRPGVRGRRARNAVWYITLAAVSAIVLFPVWMTLVRALSTPLTYLDRGLPLHPVDIQWDVFQRAFDEGHLGRQFAVSAVVTLVVTSGQMMSSILAAYAFAFLRFPAKRVVFLVFMTTLMLPIEVTLLVNVVTIRNLDWLNSYQGLTAPFLAFAFGTFLIRQGFLAIPPELRDAAELDGLGHWGFLRNVAAPLNRPVIASFGLVSFLGAWNQYTWPRAVVTEERWNTIQIGLKTVSSRNIDELNLGFAAAIIAAVPILLLLIFFQRHLIRGLTAGAVKG